MRNIHIVNSYNVWNTNRMRDKILKETMKVYDICSPEDVLNRSFTTMYVEWWFHNIGYYLTKPFLFIKSAKNINLRCKDVDLEEWKNK